MRNTQIADKVSIVMAVIPTVGTPGTMASTAVDGTAAGRCSFLLTTGAASATGTLDMKIQSSATSGGSYADVTSAAIVQIVAASCANKQYMIDIAVDSAKPFMKAVVVTGTAAIVNSVVAMLYRFVNPPATTYATQLIQL